MQAYFIYILSVPNTQDCEIQFADLLFATKIVVVLLVIVRLFN